MYKCCYRLSLLSLLGEVDEFLLFDGDLELSRLLGDLELFLLFGDLSLTGDLLSFLFTGDLFLLSELLDLDLFLSLGGGEFLFLSLGESEPFLFGDFDARLCLLLSRSLSELQFSIVPQQKVP